MSAKHTLFLSAFIVLCTIGMILFVNAINKNSMAKSHELAKSIICTEQQLAPMKRYFEVCKESGYFSSHCFDLAVINSCGGAK